MESCEAFREGGPTKSVGAGKRFGFVLAVGEGLVARVLVVLDMMRAMGCDYMVVEKQEVKSGAPPKVETHVKADDVHKASYFCEHCIRNGSLSTNMRLIVPMMRNLAAWKGELNPRTYCPPSILPSRLPCST